MTIENQILGYHLDGEGVAQLLNISKISLSQAAVGLEDAVQLGQVHSIRDAIQAQLDSMDADHSRISHVHVDTVSENLADALALGTYDTDAKTWDFGSGDVVGVGDTIILTNAADSQDRTWIHIGSANGDVTDFERLSSDLQAMVDAGVVAVTNSLRDGVATEGDTLNKLFTKITTVETTLAGAHQAFTENAAAIQTLTAEVASKVRVFYLSGTFAQNTSTNVYECTVSNSANDERARVTVKETLLSGATRKIPDSSFIETTSDTQVLLQSLAPSFDGKEVMIIVEL